MAAGVEEPEYESDPEDKLLPSAMRRREASDDEEGEGSNGERKPARVDPRDGIGSDSESDDQGGAPAYEDDEEFELEEEEAEEEELELKEDRGNEEGGDGAGVGEAEIPVAEESGVDGQRLAGERGDYSGENQVEEEEKKQNEPFAVPTAGAFYMHDDRFRESGGGRHRRTPGGRKLWESKDDQAWVHDRFEEMNLQDAHYDEKRTSKGRFRGHGKNHGAERGYARGNRSRAYDDRSQTYDDRSRAYDGRSRGYDDRSRSYDDHNKQNRAPKTVRGRGPRRYEPSLINSSEMQAPQNRQYVKSRELTSSTTTGRHSSHTLNVQPDPVVPRKQVFASSLSSASPPFYPSGSSNQDISVTSKRDAQNGLPNRNLSSSVLEDNFATSQSGALLRGKAVVDSIGRDRLYMDDLAVPVAGKTLSKLPLSSSGSSLSPINTKSPQLKVQGSGLTISGQLNYHQTSSLNQAGRGSSQAQLPAIQKRLVQTPAQPVLRASAPQLSHRPGSGTQALSPPEAQLTNFSEVGETESPSGSSKSKALLAGKGKTGGQGSGRGSFLYNGAQVIGASGAIGLAHGDQNFPATPALLQVMQFGGQHPGVPAGCMALPGYVAQQQLGFGNSEMTWVPMLAGAAGALGASYGPYVALDGGYYARPSGQTSSSTSSSRETSTSKPANIWKPSQRPEIVNDEFGQRQNKPRRYSEMNFGQ